MRCFQSKTLRRAVLLAPLAVSAAAPIAAASVNFPPMRAGFWVSTMVMHINMTGQPPDTDNTPTIRYNCLNDATMAASMKALSGIMPGCVTDLEGGGVTYTMTTKCTNPEGLTGSMDASGTFTTDSDTAIHFVETSSGDLSGMKMTSDASGDYKWTGACPAGVVPGDYGSMVNGVFKKDGNTLSNK
jgi:hypothetical protein